MIMLYTYLARVFDANGAGRQLLVTGAIRRWHHVYGNGFTVFGQNGWMCLRRR